MTKRIIYQNEDGGVSVIIPATTDLTIEQIAAKDVPTGSPYKIVDVADVPAERAFRNAWEADAVTGVISVNMAAAKDVWRDKIRQARVEPLATLDTAFMKAQETGASTTQIVADKQALRDAPSDTGIDAATTVSELAAVQSAGLTVT